MRAPRSLTSRLALAMVLVAVLSTALAGVLAAPLLHSATEDAVRSPLGAQAELLARLPRAALGRRRVTAITSAQDLALGVLTRRGRPEGAATALSAGDRASLAAGRRVSTTGSLDGVPVLLEGRPYERGGAVVLAASARSVTDASARLRERVLLALALGLVAALAAGALLARRLGAPLERAAAAARRLAAGERGVPMPADRIAEVRDVTDALHRLDEALATSERRQREFLLSVSHELRTPLTTVRGYAEAMAEGSVRPDELGEVGAVLLGESHRLGAYVEDLLALARLEADDFTLHLEDVDVAGLVTEAAAAWTPRAARAGVTLATEGTGPAWARGDPARIRQVVDALTDNAVRVCRRGDRVVLAVERTSGHVRVGVRDSGPGLSPDDVRVAFEPGTLHARYGAQRAGGAGLGLALVHRLARRMDATTEAGAAPEGGAAFTLVLPAVRNPG